LNGLKVNAEHFLERVRSKESSRFEYAQNPFKYDIAGALLPEIEGVEL
jgi:hypothetical protein